MRVIHKKNSKMMSIITQHVKDNIKAYLFTVSKSKNKDNDDSLLSFLSKVVVLEI